MHLIFLHIMQRCKYKHQPNWLNQWRSIIIICSQWRTLPLNTIQCSNTIQYNTIHLQSAMHHNLKTQVEYIVFFATHHSVSVSAQVRCKRTYYVVPCDLWVVSNSSTCSSFNTAKDSNYVLNVVIPLSHKVYTVQCSHTV